MSLSVSIIIPTHNRRELLLRNLSAFEAQTHAPGDMEVIVVADGCNDGTAEAIRNLKTGFPISLIAQSGVGAAITRNAGAQVAAGEVLIFLDDDIEPSAGLVQAHVKAQEERKGDVVIGYLPSVVCCKEKLLALNFRDWWESTFHKMRFESHLFSYRNLTSGNFSIRRNLFVDVGGFSPTFRCQEDYELGLRLIERGAQFYFEESAMGIHHDLSDLQKSLNRKIEEGKAAVLFARQFPASSASFSTFQQLRKKRKLHQQTIFFYHLHLTALASAYAAYLKFNLRLMERLRKRKSWQLCLSRLFKHYYTSGVVAATGSVEAFRAVANSSAITPGQLPIELVIDLKEGLSAAEQKIDKQRPATIAIYFNEQHVGTMTRQFGTERWRGAHLRAFLEKKAKWQLIKAIAFDNVLEQQKQQSKNQTEKSTDGDARA